MFCFSLITVLGRYITNSMNNFFVRSKEFYFYSDKLAEDNSAIYQIDKANAVNIEHNTKEICLLIENLLCESKSTFRCLKEKYEFFLCNNIQTCNQISNEENKISTSFLRNGAILWGCRTFKGGRPHKLYILLKKGRLSLNKILIPQKSQNRINKGFATFV